MAHKRLEEAAAGHAALAHRRACQKQRHGLLQARFQEGRDLRGKGRGGGRGKDGEREADGGAHALARTCDFFSVARPPASACDASACAATASRSGSGSSCNEVGKARGVVIAGDGE